MHDRNRLRRLAQALLAAALVGAALIGLLRYLLLPAIARRLAPTQIQWLRAAFRTHPALVLFAIVILVAVLGLPVLLIALRTARPGLRPNQDIARH